VACCPTCDLFERRIAETAAKLETTFQQRYLNIVRTIPILRHSASGLRSTDFSAIIETRIEMHFALHNHSAVVIPELSQQVGEGARRLLCGSDMADAPMLFLNRAAGCMRTFALFLSYRRQNLSLCALFRCTIQAPAHSRFFSFVDLETCVKPQLSCACHEVVDGVVIFFRPNQGAA
jgi:hypothetical protein